MLVPADISHAVQTTFDNTVLQIIGVGPFDVTWEKPTAGQPPR